MTDIVTDQDELNFLNGSQSGGASAAPGPAVGSPQIVTDPDELNHLNSAPAAAAPVAPTAAVPAAQPATPTLPPDRGILGNANDAVQMLTSEIPFMDRLSAGMGALTGNGTYDDNLKTERLYNAALAAAHPILSKILGLGGAGAAVLATAPESAVAAGATMGARALGGAATGAGLGALQGASDSPDLTNLPDTAARAAMGAGVGGLLGAATPPVANLVGKGFTTAANAVNGGAQGIPGKVAAPLISALQADTPAAVQSTLAGLGSIGTLADAGPSLQGQAQGAVLNSNAAKTTLYNTLASRDAATNARLGQDVDAALGPAQSPLQVSQAIQAARSQIHSTLPAIFAGAPPVDTSGVLSQIGHGLSSAVGPEAAVLSKARDYLMTTAPDAQGNMVPVPVSDPQTLQNAKMALDMLIDRGDPTLGVQPGAISKAQGSVANVRAQLNQTLRAQVPGYANVMDKSSHLASIMDAIEQGNGLLNGGQTAVNPADLTQQLAQTASKGLGPMSPIVGDLQGLRVGVRGAVDRAMGTKANDLVALRNTLQGEGGWNSANLGTVFGQQPTQDVVDSIARNSTFRDTYQNVIRNSQTAMRTAAANSMKPQPPGGLPMVNPNMTVTGFLGTGAKNLGKALLQPFVPDPTAHYGQIANILSAQGPQRDAYLTSLVSALQRRGGNAATGQTVGNASALAAALMANKTANDRLRGP